MYGCEESIKQEALSKWPEEMVGYIKDGNFHALKNISKTPKRRYQISPSDTIKLLSIDIDYLVHSHPTLDNNPSDLDLRSQKSTGIPFLIIGTDGKETTTIKEVL